MGEEKPLLVLCGPTASGKTALAVRLAKHFHGEVVSADSMQIYRGMDVGTAKPTQEEMQGIPHHMINILDPAEEFSVADYAEKARRVIADLHGRGKLPVVAGGTGLYIQAITDHIQYEDTPSDPALRKDLEKIGREQGAQVLWEMLRKEDPALAEKLHPNNMGRVIRGIEVNRLTGASLSQMQDRSRQLPSPYRLFYLGLTFSDRQVLYDRIGRRIELMVDQGVVEEARWLLSGNVSRTAAQAIGYKEWIPYLAGDCTFEEAKEHLKMQTRRYAKRQLTWFRRDSRICWLEVDAAASEEQLLDCAIQVLRNAGLVAQT